MHRLTLLLTFAAALTAAPHRGLLVCVSGSAPAEIRTAALSILKAVPTHPLLAVFAKDSTPNDICVSEQLAAQKPADQRAYNHLVLVGLPSDPMIAGANQREARLTANNFYVFGFGHFTGDIGYIESDRNPFLHGLTIPIAPFETEVVTITGNSAAGVVLAANAFLHQSLVNGVVAAPGWKHPTPNLLDRDPLVPNFQTPDWLPAKQGPFQKIAVTQAAEDEYRGVLADTGVEPQEIWRAKYYRDGAWDGEGEVHAFDEYSAGLHRRAYGNTLWVARFATEAEAKAAAPKIAAAASLQAKGATWTGVQPAYAGGKNAGETDSAGPLTLWLQKDWVVMSTIPAP